METHSKATISLYQYEAYLLPFEWNYPQYIIPCFDYEICLIYV